MLVMPWAGPSPINVSSVIAVPYANISVKQTGAQDHLRNVADGTPKPYAVRDEAFKRLVGVRGHVVRHEDAHTRDIGFDLVQNGRKICTGLLDVDELICIQERHPISAVFNNSTSKHKLIGFFFVVKWNACFKKRDVEPLGLKLKQDVGCSVQATIVKKNVMINVRSRMPNKRFNNICFV